MANTKVDKGAIANAWLSNPVVVYGLVAVLVGFSIYFLTPRLYDGAKKAFGTWVDDIRDGVAGILGKPESQDPSQRTASDTVRGVFVSEDRALSDIYDATLGRFFN